MNTEAVAEQPFSLPVFSPDMRLDDGDAAELNAIDRLSNNAAKLVTALALGTFEPGELVRQTDIAMRLVELQGEHIVWPVTPMDKTPMDYCFGGIINTGLGEEGIRTVDGRSTRAVRLNERGWELGLAIAGAFSTWQRIRRPLTVGHMLGSSRQMGKKPGTPTRLAIYDELLRRDNHTAGLAELARQCNVVGATVLHATRIMEQRGFVRKIDRRDPAQRMFAISQPEERTLRNLARMRPGLRAAICAAGELSSAGLTTVSGEVILQRAQQIDPEVALGDIWQVLLEWVSQRGTCVKDLDYADGNNLLRAKIALLPEIVEPVGELLAIRHTLATNAAFRLQASKEAKRMATDPQAIVAVLGHTAATAGPTRIIGDAEWSELFETYVGPRNISLEALHRLATAQLGQVVSRQQLERRARAAQLQVSARPPRSPSSAGRRTPITHVRSLENTHFSDNWPTRAACRDEDPELFYPVGTTGPALQQVEAAKAVCRRCPVRLACKKTAINNDERFGVWGGVWFENPKAELTPAERAAIRSSITID